MKKLCFLMLLMSVLVTRNVLAGNWSVQESGITKDLWSVHFVDVNNGWVVGEDGLILHTNNGGIIWKVQKSKVNVALCGIYFINKNNGWIGGRGGVQHTIDGGINWEIQNVRVESTSIYFIDAKHGWVVGLVENGGIILHTNNSGKTWGTQTIIGSSYFDWISGVQFI
ncbi:MAG: YCF48-related protein, partial [Candidatus Desantisbacteria bacterium]